MANLSNVKVTGAMISLSESKEEWKKLDDSLIYNNECAPKFYQKWRIQINGGAHQQQRSLGYKLSNWKKLCLEE